MTRYTITISNVITVDRTNNDRTEDFAICTDDHETTYLHRLCGWIDNIIESHKNDTVKPFQNDNHG